MRAGHSPSRQRRPAARNKEVSPGSAAPAPQHGDPATSRGRTQAIESTGTIGSGATRTRRPSPSRATSGSSLTGTTSSRRRWAVRQHVTRETPMIALSKFQETQRLLALGGLSQRKIAVMVGISRATVGAIAQGKYRDREARQRDRSDDFVPNGPLERCPSCGGMVYLPCLVCRVRKIKDQEQRMLRAARRGARAGDAPVVARGAPAVLAARRARNARQDSPVVICRPPMRRDRPTANRQTGRALPAAARSQAIARASATGAKAGSRRFRCAARWFAGSWRRRS